MLFDHTEYWIDLIGREINQCVTVGRQDAIKILLYPSPSDMSHAGDKIRPEEVFEGLVVTAVWFQDEIQK